MNGTSAGRLVGALFVPLGVLFSWLAGSMLSSGAPTLRLFTAGPAIALVGLAFFFFPGAPVTVAQLKEKSPQAQREWLTGAPRLHKAAWLVALGLGLLVSRRLGLE